MFNTEIDSSNQQHWIINESEEMFFLSSRKQACGDERLREPKLQWRNSKSVLERQQESYAMQTSRVQAPAYMF